MNGQTLLDQLEAHHNLNRWHHPQGRLKGYKWRIVFEGSGYRGQLIGPGGGTLIDMTHPSRSYLAGEIEHWLNGGW
jgi:hypothetical protein